MQILALFILNIWSCIFAGSETNNVVTKYNFFTKSADGKYSYAYRITDGTYRQESGYYRTIDDKKSFEVSGNYGFIDPDGKHHDFFYTSGVDGFKIKIQGDLSMPPTRVSDFPQSSQVPKPN